MLPASGLYPLFTLTYYAILLIAGGIHHLTGAQAAHCQTCISKVQCAVTKANGIKTLPHFNCFFLL